MRKQPLETSADVQLSRKHLSVNCQLWLQTKTETVSVSLPLLRGWLTLQLNFFIRCTSVLQGTPDVLQPWKAGAQPAALGSYGIQIIQKKLPERETSSKGLGRCFVLTTFHSCPGLDRPVRPPKACRIPKLSQVTELSAPIPQSHMTHVPCGTNTAGICSGVPQQPSRPSGSGSSPWLSQRKG